MKNNGYWGTKYKDVLSGAIFLSIFSIIISITVMIFKENSNYFESYSNYSFVGLMLAVYLIVNYCINYYLLIKKYGFIGCLKKFLYGFIPCVAAICIAVFVMMK